MVQQKTSVMKKKPGLKLSLGDDDSDSDDEREESEGVIGFDSVTLAVSC